MGSPFISVFIETTMFGTSQFTLPLLVYLSVAPLSLTAEVRRGCPATWTQFEGKCYKYFNQKMYREEARVHCHHEKADLVSIHSAKENEFVANLVCGARVWLLGRRSCRLCGEFLWEDGTPWNFENWLRRQPDNHGGIESCLEMNYAEKGTWNDVNCIKYNNWDNYKLAFACKKR